MKDKEKQIEEMAKIIDDRLIEGMGYLGSMNRGTGYWIAQKLIEHYQPKLYEDSVVLSNEEYEILKKIEKSYDPFWFCTFGGCEGVCKECKDTCEMSIFVKERKETAKKFYDKINENICVFKLENKSKEYKDGYAKAIADICERLDQVAKQFGVEIKGVGVWKSIKVVYNTLSLSKQTTKMKEKY